MAISGCCVEPINPAAYRMLDDLMLPLAVVAKHARGDGSCAEGDGGDVKSRVSQSAKQHRIMNIQLIEAGFVGRLGGKVAGDFGGQACTVALLADESKKTFEKYP